MIIYRGDQYAIPFKIRIGKMLVTPELVNDVRIQIDDDLREESSSESLVYNSEKGTWDFYVTEEFTRRLARGPVTYQVGVKMGNEIRHSSSGRITLGDNIIEKRWNNE